MEYHHKALYLHCRHFNNLQKAVWMAVSVEVVTVVYMLSDRVSDLSGLVEVFQA